MKAKSPKHFARFQPPPPEAAGSFFARIREERPDLAHLPSDRLVEAVVRERLLYPGDYVVQALPAWLVMQDGVAIRNKRSRMLKTIARLDKDAYGHVSAGNLSAARACLREAGDIAYRVPYTIPGRGVYPAGEITIGGWMEIARVWGKSATSFKLGADAQQDIVQLLQQSGCETLPEAAQAGYLSDRDVTAFVAASARATSRTLRRIA